MDKATWRASCETCGWEQRTDTYAAAGDAARGHGDECAEASTCVDKWLGGEVMPMTEPEYERCFYCTERAEYKRWSSLPHPSDVDWVELLATGRLDDPRPSSIQLVGAACRLHDDALVEALMDYSGTGSVGGERLFNSETPCSHDMEKTEPTQVEGNIWETHFRCRICGMETMSVTTPPADIKSNPAYLRVIESVRR